MTGIYIFTKINFIKYYIEKNEQKIDSGMDHQITQGGQGGDPLEAPT
ncbi:hypothetical protein [Pasteuria penetrans]|nr:hypothetical protein [Pasteuria penetrans]